MLKRIAFVLSMLTLLFAVAAFAQNTASIKGTVTDTSGAAVVGAKVTVTAVGIERITTTNSSGDYEVPALPPGVYTVKIEQSGFQTQQAEHVTLEVSKNTVQNFGLKVASATEVVTVEGTAPIIEATTMTVGQTINQNTVQEIPLNGRHFVDLALLIPGSVVPPQNGFLTAPLRGQGSFAFNTAGNREDAVNFMINGINLNDMVQNQVTFQPTINTVSEFKVDNSTYSAEYGRNSGAIVNIATRSGTNQFHGEVYDYMRNEWFDARNAFNPVTVTSGGVTTPNPISHFKRNQFGGDVGGPIFKDRTFFFASYEGLRQRQGLTLTSPVWTDAQRNDIIAGGNPISINLMNLVPHANSGNRFVGSAVAPVDIDQGTGDINHKFTDQDQIHGYYVYQHDLRRESAAGTTIPNFGDTREGHRQVLTVNETHVFTSNVVNEARLGANRIHITFTPNNAIDPNSLGLGSILGPNLKFMPVISVGDLGLLFGSERGFPQGRGDTTAVLGDTLSWVRGRHSLKFGGEWRDFRNNNFNGDPGQLVFNCSVNAVPTATCPVISGGSTNAFALGRVTSALRTVGDIHNRITERALDFFAQDTFKMTSSLTVELGLRWAWNMSPTEAMDRFATLVPIANAAANGSLLVPVSEPYAQNNKNFQPRVGFAWDMARNGNTVLRGGYAYQVDQPITNYVTGLNSNPPFALPISVAGATPATPIPYASLTGSFNGPPSTVSPGLINPNFHDANVQSWNLNVQQQVGRSIAFMVGYFGSKGTHLEIDRNINQFLTLGTPASRPFRSLSPSSPILPGVGLGNALTERDSNSTSTYHALWITANKKLSHGLQFNASYTYSHSIDDVSRNSNGVVVPDSLNIISGKGNSDFDARHRFVINAIYQLPFKGNRAVSGWELATIVSAQSGNPFTIVVPSANITGVGNTVTPLVLGQITVTKNPLNQWVLPTNFAIQPTGTPTTFGNMGRNSVLGPNFRDVDLAVVKNTKITERLNFQIRADAFDLFNHPNYGQPNRVLNSLGSTTFGFITSTRFPTGDSGSSRQLQLAAKFQF